MPYIEREELLKDISETVVFTVRNGVKLPTAEMRGANKVIDRIKSAPTADVVSSAVLEQVMWERDMALETLEEHGIGFCEKSDVVKVRHGEWFLLDECSNEGVYCSVCHKKVYKTNYANQKLKSKYCPNCGAKMDGKGD